LKSHEIKNAKRRLAQLKTLLTQRLQNLEQEDQDLVRN
jgi:ribosomal protein L29